MRHYLSFCRAYNIPPWPASETTLRYYCVHAYRTIRHPSIMVYLAAIRHSHLERGYQDPLIDKPLLDYLCKGIRRHQGYQTRARLPLTSSLLTDLRTTLNHSSAINSYDKQAMWAAITLGFYGFLRAGEFTTNHNRQYEISRHLLLKDVTLATGSYSVVIKGSKTDQDRRSVKLKVGATGTTTCPVRAMRAFLKEATHRRSTPLFTLSSGQYLTRTKLTSSLRLLLEATGLTPEQAARYSSHSLRIGAATEAAAAGLPTWLIQTAGRWRSDAYRRYIRPPSQALLSVAPALARRSHT